MRRELALAKSLIQEQGIREFLRLIDKRIVNFARYKKHRTTNLIRYGSSAPGYYEMIKINPQEVEKMVVTQFYISETHIGGHVKGGNWDCRKLSSDLMYANRHERVTDNRGLLPIKNFGLYRSMKKHFKDGLPWPETEFYDWITDTEYGKYHSSATIEHRLSVLDRLYEDIVTNGYKSQGELQTDNNYLSNQEHSEFPEYSEVWIDITRNGEIVFEEGRHRFIIAKLANVEEIPARVFVRHKKWQEKRKMASKGKIPRGLNPQHPDLTSL